ncbi:uncharacterized protein LOC119671530 [Teleopsis dalmanni]|uniref:uncharacterized protein LOC119671530 n=1 Tax=Teleopsis dalmanni TaxID=139649 RepID=UPI0018CEDA04|nr:uncharacterized protein LOC119671530 [Teleopsis dalmanni]
MVNRKANDSGRDTNAELAISYIREFSLQAGRYRTQKTEEVLLMINRSASVLSTTIQAQYFNPLQLEISKFFIDLHAVMTALPPDSDALWTCVTLVTHCMRNLDARRAIIEEYRFVPMLTLVLKRTQAEDKRRRVLVLLQELTYGIRITWEESYLTTLFNQLIGIINNATDGDETDALVALSIIINLIYKNFVVHFLFLRTVNISKLTRKILNYGMLANKLLIILSDDFNAPDEKYMQTFLRTTFSTIDDCIRNWNVPHLRHIVDFLTDSSSNCYLHNALMNYTYYVEDIERILENLENVTDGSDPNEDLRKHQHMSLGLIFQLLRYILNLSLEPRTDGTENIISIDSNIPRLYELLSFWVSSDICGVDAINLLDTLVLIAKKDTLSQRISRDPALVIQLIAITENTESTAQHKSAILQFLLTLLHQNKTEKLILSKITESYFDKLLAPLLASKTETSVTTMAIEEIEKSIFCLVLLINFASIAKKAYFEKCCMLLQMQQIQYSLARGILNGGETVACAIFKISQFEHFPQAQVAKEISSLNASSKYMTHTPSSEQWCNINSILKSHKNLVSKEVEERLQALIELLSNAHRNNQLNNIATSHVVELLNYNVQKFEGIESSMRDRLDAASAEITNLTQRINLQNAELQKYHTLNFELHINQENLQTECKDLKKQKENLTINLTDLMKKLSQSTESLQVSEKRLSVKISEMIALQQQHKELIEQFTNKTEELEKLQATSKDNVVRIEKLKKSLVAFETDIKEKVRIIDDRDRELAKSHKALEELKEAKKKSEGIITVLEGQIQEKNETIRNYEMELSETEEMRKTIMSLMESKKPKRK